MPIRLRLALIVAVVAGLFVASGGYVFGRQLRASVGGAVDDSLTPRREAIARALQASSVPTDPAGLTATLVDEEQLAQVIEPSGRVVMASGSLATSPLLSSRDVERVVLGGATTLTINLKRSTEVDSVRLTARPVSRSDGVWVVVLGSALAVSELALDRVHLALWIGGPLAVLASAAGAWALAAAALRPVERMRRQVAAITEQGPEVTIEPPATRDELARMTATVNELLVRLHDARARDRRLIADAGHELRTPLAVLRTELELAARPGRTAGDLRDSVSHAVDEVDRLARLAANLLFLASSDVGSTVRPDPAPLPPVLEAAAAACRERAAAAGVRVVARAPEELTVPCDADRIRQALDNLLDNALRVAPAGSELVVEAVGEGPWCRLSVLDEGPGFPETFLPRAFERFSRPDSVRASSTGGAGLGLAIVDAIARAHGGRATAANRPGGGARVELLLPRSTVGRTSEPESMHADRGRWRAPPPAGHGRDASRDGRVLGPPLAG